jgi:hypothetical protein
MAVSKLEIGRDQIKKWPVPMKHLAAANRYKSPRSRSIMVGNFLKFGRF